MKRNSWRALGSIGFFLMLAAPLTSTAQDAGFMDLKNWSGLKSKAMTPPTITADKTPDGKAAVKATVNLPGNMQGMILTLPEPVDLAQIDTITFKFRQNGKTLSLEGDYEMQNGSEVKLIDIIEDKKSSVHAEIEYESMKKDVVKMLNGLKDREQKVITMRFGLNGLEKQTLEEIGKIYGVTKECIRQTESRALNKLKNNISFNLLMDYVY